jgi:SAM-dependent methyltransferase
MPPAEVVVHAEGDMDADRYFLPPGYQQREKPGYFLDDEQDGILWQPDVYPFATDVASRHGCTAIIDLGCGRGGKLATIRAARPHWKYFGVDVGPNIAWCQANRPFGRWIEADLETCRTLPLSTDEIRTAVVVCSDVLEHLVRPEIAVGLVASLLRVGSPAAVLSTPAREHRAGPRDPGPPRNPSHVREWAGWEFRGFLSALGLEIADFTLTRSDNGGGGRTTQLVLVDAGERPEIREEGPH